MSHARTAPPQKTPKRPTPPEAIPRSVARPSLDDHLEILTRAIFQAGLSWAIIAARWPVFLAAFERFDVARVAAYGEDDRERLMATDGLIHSVKKLEATIRNARTFLDLRERHGTVEAYIAGFRSYADLFADAHGRFEFLGDLSCYYWLFRTNNPVPIFETWIEAQRTDHPRMREMVLKGRTEKTSSELAGF